MALLPVALLYDCKVYKKEDLVKNFLAVRMAVKRLKEGGGDKDDFDLIVMICNATAVRALQIDQSLVDIAESGKEALARCKARYFSHGVFGFDGPGLAEIDATIEVYEAIAEKSTPMQMQRAVDVVNATLAKSRGEIWSNEDAD